MQITSPFLEGERGKIQSLKRKKGGMKAFKVSHQRRNKSLINSPKNMTRSQVERRNSSDEESGGRRLLRQGKRSR